MNFLIKTVQIFTFLAFFGQTFAMNQFLTRSETVKNILERNNVKHEILQEEPKGSPLGEYLFLGVKEVNKFGKFNIEGEVIEIEHDDENVLLNIESNFFVKISSDDLEFLIINKILDVEWNDLSNIDKNENKKFNVSNILSKVGKGLIYYCLAYSIITSIHSKTNDKVKMNEQSFSFRPIEIKDDERRLNYTIFNNKHMRVCHQDTGECVNVLVDHIFGQTDYFPQTCCEVNNVTTSVECSTCEKSKLNNLDFDWNQRLDQTERQPLMDTIKSFINKNEGDDNKINCMIAFPDDSSESAIETYRNCYEYTEPLFYGGAGIKCDSIIHSKDLEKNLTSYYKKFNFNRPIMIVIGNIRINNLFVWAPDSDERYRREYEGCYKNIPNGKMPVKIHISTKNEDVCSIPLPFMLHELGHNKEEDDKLMEYLEQLQDISYKEKFELFNREIRSDYLGLITSEPESRVAALKSFFSYLFNDFCLRKNLYDFDNLNEAFKSIFGYNPNKGDVEKLLNCDRITYIDSNEDARDPHPDIFDRIQRNLEYIYKIGAAERYLLNNAKSEN
ncbi:MAG: hypothetical protein SZ59_C0003G0045 [candidate division TM6 bacterium GW2011_GWF2_28_16]|nr:MAG: hypothetical protein SZ59_C0003G0045 [candidate division TM6 bacterium GW2011_GWF2_28_16]